MMATRSMRLVKPLAMSFAYFAIAMVVVGKCGIELNWSV